ncbi:MRG family protein, putative isoform 1 [Quillaja saponaria]|uniref:MRG family protein, putative isoform 1 n=1 Tax=Quillaja saponaria TaxID=32244 RepID=A0AAD7LJJ9_QUISA|nr:MRG family protein, putative isoform 1 [Quillaja saponaria]
MGSFKTTTEVTDDSATETDCDATATSEKTKSDSDSDIDIDIDIDNDTGDDCPPPPDSSPFAEGEKVLAFHNCRIYEAKITKLDHRMKEWRFHLHYLGWNKSWDEWVGVDRLLKYTEENVQKQQELNKKDGNDKNSRAARASHMKPKSSNVARGKKRKNDSISKEKAATPLDKLVNIQIPLTLKKQLVDDCEFITHLGKLVKLPRVPNVDDILQKYLDYRLKKDGLIGDSVGEIVKGLCCYFDKALPVILLYNNERQQYEEACASDVFPSTVYGAEHLLRLFVKLPEFLFHANIEEETLMELQTNLVDFLKFLQKNQSLFFLSTYHVPEDIENCPNKQDD